MWNASSRGYPSFPRHVTRVPARGSLLDVGKTVNAAEKGAIGRRLRRLLLFAVLASGVAELIKYLQSQGLLK
jgi:hypothetical protein